MIDLSRVLRTTYPRAIVDYEPPLRSTGPHYLYLRCNDRVVSVVWRSDFQFRIAELSADDDEGFDSGPSAQLETVADAITHIQRLLGGQLATASAR